MTSQEGWRRQSRWLFALVLGLAACLALTLIALDRANGALDGEKHVASAAQQAAARAQAVADCVNAVLASRQQTTTNDALAELSFINAVNAVVILPAGPSQDAAFVAFEKAALDAAKTLTDDETYRTTHPLGRC